MQFTQDMERISVLLYLSGALSFSSALIYQRHVFVKQNMTWYQAQLYCQTNYTDLVTIKSKWQMDLANSLITVRGIIGVWIGLYRNTTTYLFQWSNGEQFMYSRWATGQPGQDNMCTAMSSLWYDLPCSNPCYFVCFQGKNSINLNCDSQWTFFYGADVNKIQP
ncbi:macrophage mannose receptor 1-like [Protopterus annectens]|uniref:macrophage mannose receptor 1-like n=1 Tax=Protopterus annectens TaxID=7888 RepID=UPI001CF988DE|nr:macrophage mannose receptor 1-like [Protopterus annectens]